MRGNPTGFPSDQVRKARRSVAIWYGTVVAAVLASVSIWALWSILWTGGLTLGKSIEVGLLAVIAWIAVRWFFNSALALTRNDILGVRIDIGKNLLVYWTRSTPAFTKSIGLDKIAVIRHDREDDSVTLLDAAGRVIPFDSSCLRDSVSWSDSITRTYSHIRLERR